MRVEDGVRVVPHHLKLKIEWGTHSEARPKSFRSLSTKSLPRRLITSTIVRYSTLAPIDIEAEVDIFTSGVSVDPTYGELEEQ